MEKLELKHFAPYLPYGLRFIYCDSPEERYILELKSCAEDYVTCPDTDYSYNDIKPILRPLSDLTKKDIDYIYFQIIATDNDMYGSRNEFEDTLNELLYCSEHLPVLVFDYLLENHFDVFGLLESGLAVDINTI